MIRSECERGEDNNSRRILANETFKWLQLTLLEFLMQSGDSEIIAAQYDISPIEIIEMAWRRYEARCVYYFPIRFLVIIDSQPKDLILRSFCTRPTRSI